MATKVWRGITAPISQVSTLTVGGTVSGGESFTITVGNASMVVVAAAAGAAAAAAQIQAALTSFTNVPAQMREITWTVVGVVITATGPVGVPFTVSSAATGSATFVTATPTNATGLNFANVAGNWSGGTLPLVGDDLIIPAGSPSILYGLTTLTVLFASVTVEPGFRNRIGLTNNNSSEYLEYRDRYWSINTSKLTIGSPGVSSESSQQVKFDLKATATNVLVRGSGRARSGESGVELIGGANATLSVENAVVACSRVPAEASNFASLLIASSGSVYLGANCVVDDVDVWGSLTAQCPLPSITTEAGSTTASGQITALTINGGVVQYQAVANITSASIGTGLLAVPIVQPITIGSLTLRKGGVFHDPNGIVTITTLVKSGINKLTAA